MNSRTVTTNFCKWIFRTFIMKETATLCNENTARTNTQEYSTHTHTCTILIRSIIRMLCCMFNKFFLGTQNCPSIFEAENDSQEMLSDTDSMTTLSCRAEQGIHRRAFVHSFGHGKRTAANQNPVLPTEVSRCKAMETWVISSVLEL